MLENSECELLLTEETFLDNDHLNMLSEIVPEIRDRIPDRSPTKETAH